MVNILTKEVSMSVRKTTCKALEMADQGLISWKTLAECALKYMSEDEVADMLKANEIIVEEDEDEEDREV
jgi:hypothetical protein